MKCPHCFENVPVWEIHRFVYYTKGITNPYEEGYADNKVVERKCEYCFGWKKKEENETDKS